MSTRRVEVLAALGRGLLLLCCWVAIGLVLGYAIMRVRRGW